MKLTIVAVGKLKERHWREAAAEYLARLRPYADVRVVEIADRPLDDEPRALRAEAVQVLRALPEGARVVALDLGGAARDSAGLAGWLATAMNEGRSSIAFVVGGAAGLDSSVLARADERLSLGPLTLPHQLARVVLLEQLYRCFRIIRGEPYHR